jgi:hypothetical protein
VADEVGWVSDAVEVDTVVVGWLKVEDELVGVVTVVDEMGRHCEKNTMISMSIEGHRSDTRIRTILNSAHITRDTSSRVGAFAHCRCKGHTKMWRPSSPGLHIGRIPAHWGWTAVKTSARGPGDR